MASKGSTVRVVKRGDEWGVRKDGNQRDSGHFGTQKQAIERGKDLAKKEGGELVVHGRDGRIRSKDSYGSDPNPPRDREH